jgi:hypothetical protein
MDGLLPRDAILSFLADFRREAEAYLEVLEKEIRRDARNMPFCGRAAAELGLEGYRLDAQWAKRTYARLKAGSANKGESS